MTLINRVSKFSVVFILASSQLALAKTPTHSDRVDPRFDSSIITLGCGERNHYGNSGAGSDIESDTVERASVYEDIYNKSLDARSFQQLWKTTCLWEESEKVAKLQFDKKLDLPLFDELVSVAKACRAKEVSLIAGRYKHSWSIFKDRGEELDECSAWSGYQSNVDVAISIASVGKSALGKNGLASFKSNCELNYVDPSAALNAHETTNASVAESNSLSKSIREERSAQRTAVLPSVGSAIE